MLVGSVSIRETANQIQLLLQEKTDAARVKHCCIAQGTEASWK